MAGKSTKLLPSLDIVFSEAKSALDFQHVQLSSLDMKLGVLLGLSGVILAALLSFPLIRNGNMVTKGLLIAAAALILVSLVSAALGYWVRKYERAPDPRALREFYLVEQPEVTKMVIVDTLLSVYDRNQNRIARKAERTKISFVFVFLGALIIAVTILYNLL